MHIDDAIHALVQHIVHHFFHASHPGLVDIVVTVKMLIPGYRNTYGIETCVLENLEEFRRSHRLPPASLVNGSLFPCQSRVTCIQRVSQVPANLHIGHSLRSRFEIGGKNR